MYTLNLNNAVTNKHKQQAEPTRVGSSNETLGKTISQNDPCMAPTWRIHHPRIRFCLCRTIRTQWLQPWRVGSCAVGSTFKSQRNFKWWIFEHQIWKKWIILISWCFRHDQVSTELSINSFHSPGPVEPHFPMNAITWWQVNPPFLTNPYIYIRLYMCIIRIIYIIILCMYIYIYVQIHMLDIVRLYPNNYTNW
jgi:hypothetical protein